MSPRRNWDSPTPSLTSECTLLPEPKGGGGVHTCKGGEVGGVGTDGRTDGRLEKIIAICLLCASRPRNIKDTEEHVNPLYSLPNDVCIKFRSRFTPLARQSWKTTA
jgi:hypothetical protein